MVQMKEYTKLLFIAIRNRILRAEIRKLKKNKWPVISSWFNPTPYEWETPNSLNRVIRMVCRPKPIIKIWTKLATNSIVITRDNWKAIAKVNYYPRIRKVTFRKNKTISRINAEVTNLCVILITKEWVSRHRTRRVLSGRRMSVIQIKRLSLPF